MPTVFDKITEALSNSELNVQLGGQVTALTSIGAKVSDLIQHPPSELSDLVQQIDTLPLPQVDILDDLQAAIGSLQSVVPNNLDGVTGDLAGGITGLAQSLGKDLVDQVTPVVGLYQALKHLLELAGEKKSGDGAPSAAAAVALALPVGAPVAAAAPAVLMMATAEGQVRATLVLDALNRLPSPLSVDRLLQFLHDMFQGLPRSLAPVSQLPVLDKTQQTLETLTAWRAGTGTDLANHIESTLQATAALIGQSADAVIDPVLAQINTMSGQLDAVNLRAVLDGLSLELGNLGTAVEATDLPAINTALATLNSQKAQLDTMLLGLRNDYFSGQSVRLLEQVKHVPSDLEGAICLLLSALEPAADANPLGALAARVNAAFTPEQVTGYTDALKTVLDFLRALLDKLDLSVLEGPLSTAATAAQSAVDTLDDVLIGIVTQVSLLFDQVDKVVDSVDTTAITDAVEQALAAFQQSLEEAVNTLFSPIHAAIDTAVEAIDSSVDAFDPEAIMEALRSALQSLTGVLSDPQILGALQSIKATITAASDELKALSFTPASDLVVEQIDAVTVTLASIDPDELNDGLKFALSAALALLPGEDAIRGVKADLLVDMDALVEAGPISLLGTLKVQPDKLLAQVKNYSPAKLIGDQLSKPFQAVVSEVEPFKPSALLAPLEEALAQVRTTLEKEANPGLLIAPLEPPFAALMAAFDQLNPAALVAPLQAQIDTIVNLVLDALPLETFFEVIDAILNPIQTLSDNLEVVQQVIQKLSDLLSTLADPSTQVEVWINSILDKLNEIPGSIDLQPAFDQIAVAVEQVKATALVGRINPPLTAFVGALDLAQPGPLLTQLIRDHRDFPRAAAEGLPEPERQNVLDFLNGFVPLGTSISEPLNGLQQFTDALRTQPDAISTFLAGWDAVYHRPNSTLQQCIPADTSLAGVRTLLQETLQQQVQQPMVELLGVLSNLKPFVDGILEVLSAFITDFQAKLTTLLTGPASLTSIRNAMQGVVDKIRGFNLNFLVDELNDLFTNVKSKLDPISPATLRGIVEVAFADALSKIDVSTLIPAAQVAALDAGFMAIVNKLKALDPGPLVSEVLQPEFDAHIEPLLEAFDLNAFLAVVINRIQGLKEELGVELDRIITAFIAMLDAAPTIDLLSIDIDIDIDVDIGF